MQIRFTRQVATERGAFRLGRIVTVPRLPKGWATWLQSGVIEILPEDDTEIAVAEPEPEQAVTPPRRRRRRRKTIDGPA